DQEPPPRARMKPPCLVEQLASGHPGQPLAREYQSHLVAGARELRQTRPGLVRRARAQHPVMRRVAVAQLTLAVQQRALILIDGDNRGAHKSSLKRRQGAVYGCHRPFSAASRMRAPSRSPPRSMCAPVLTEARRVATPRAASPELGETDPPLCLLVLLLGDILEVV